jgi:hypothetical protein
MTYPWGAPGSARREEVSVEREESGWDGLGDVSGWDGLGDIGARHGRGETVVAGARECALWQERADRARW